MKACWCSLAGTNACKNCPNSFSYEPFIDYQNFNHRWLLTWPFPCEHCYCQKSATVNGVKHKKCCKCGSEKSTRES